MSNSSNKRHEEVETVIRSCLIARQGDVSIQQLNQDYVEFEGENIPFREFNYPSLHLFLKSLHNVLRIESKYGNYYAIPIESEKSRHVSSLVEGQKPKKSHPKKSQKSYVGFSGGRPQRLVRDVPHQIGMWENNFHSARRSRNESHRTYIPAPRFLKSCNQSSNSNYRFVNQCEPASERNSYVKSNHTSSDERDLPVRFTGEDDHLPNVDNDSIFLPAGYAGSVSSVKQNGFKHRQTARPSNEDQHFSNQHFETSNEEITSSLDMYSNNKEDSSVNYQKERISENPQMMSNVSCDDDAYEDDDYVVNDDNMVYDDYEESRGILINERTRQRLAILIQNHPDGIWCADLPNLYLAASGVSLNYSELGFGSVREYASQLPEIFHCIRPTDAGDYKLYNAQKPLPDLRNTEPRSRLSLAATYHIYDDSLDEPEIFPGKLERSTTEKLIPEGVMEIGESVGHVSVTELGRDRDYEEVEISEVFTPSFFWIQLRKKLPKFKKFMDDLHSFYESNKSKYKIPLIILEKGLNVACLYSNRWHRGIIKTVLPDGRSNIHFYDYGTVKTYGPDELFFLHRQFSYLPAQAIPCGLYNVRPYNTTKWSKIITWEFITKTSVPLVATIGSRDEEENSMLISLTDTRNDEDFHINDWMYAQKYADQGQMVRIRVRNFAFVYYKECLERKGYDPSAIYNSKEFRDINNSNDNDVNGENTDNPEISLSPVNRLVNDKKHLKDSTIASKNPFPGVYQNSSLSEQNNLKKSKYFGNVAQNFSENKVLEATNKSMNIPDPCGNQSRNEAHFRKDSSVTDKGAKRRNHEFLSDSRSKSKSVDKKQLRHSDGNFLNSSKVMESKLENSALAEKSFSGPGALKRTLALLAQFQSKEQSVNNKITLSQSNNSFDSPMYKNTSESSKSSHSKSISSLESETKIDMLRRMMMQKQNMSTKQTEIPAVTEELSLESSDKVPSSIPRKEVHLNSDDQSEDQPSVSVKKSNEYYSHQLEGLPKLKNITPWKKPESSLDSDSTESDPIPVCCPLLLKETPDDDEEPTFFGSLKSECGGSGRMEPMNWAAIRSAVKDDNEKVKETPKMEEAKKEMKPVDLQSQVSKSEVSDVRSEMKYIIDADSNLSYYEKHTKFLPSGNIKHSQSNVSPLLKLKQRIHANSFKSSSVLVSSKILKILKGKLQGACELDGSSETFENEVALNKEGKKDTEEKKLSKLENLSSKASGEASDDTVAKVSESLEKENLEEEVRVEKFGDKSNQSSAEEEKHPVTKSRKISKEKRSTSSVNSTKYSSVKTEVEKDSEVKSLVKELKSPYEEAESPNEEKLRSLHKQTVPLDEGKLRSSHKQTVALDEERPKFPDKEETISLVREESRFVDHKDSKILEADQQKQKYQNSRIPTEIPEALKLKQSSFIDNFEERADKSKESLANGFTFDLEPELPDASQEMSNDLKEKDLSSESEEGSEKEEREGTVLNVVDSSQMTTSKKFFLERLNRLNRTNSIGSLDSDDLSSLDNEDESPITECKRLLSPRAKCDESLEEEVRPPTNSSLDNEDESPITECKTLLSPGAKYDESLKEEVEPPTIEADDSKAIEIANQPNKPREYVFNDLDVESEDEQWDVMSYLSSQSYRSDPIFRLSKEYSRNYKKMIEDQGLEIEDQDLEIEGQGLQIEDQGVQIEEIPNDSNVKGIENSKETVAASNFVNFQYTSDMKRNKRLEELDSNPSPEVSSEKDSRNPSSDCQDFSLNSNELSNSLDKWEPPGRAKSLKRMLLQMMQ